MKIITEESQFETAILEFQQYKAVKVYTPLKETFHRAITTHFISMGVDKWSATLTPLKNSWKFKRTKVP